MAGSYEREFFWACGECIVPSKPLMEALRGLGHRLIQWTATLTTARGIIAKLKAGTGSDRTLCDLPWPVRPTRSVRSVSQSNGPGRTACHELALRAKRYRLNR